MCEVEKFVFVRFIFIRTVNCIYSICNFIDYYNVFKIYFLLIIILNEGFEELLGFCFYIYLLIMFFYGRKLFKERGESVNVLCWLGLGY